MKSNWMNWGCVLALAVAGCSEQVVERAETRPLVRVGTARQGVTFVDALRVQGTVRAKDAAGVSARIPGTLDAVFADEGDRVKKGSALFQVDRQNLENAVRAAKDDLAMAKAKLAQAEVTVGKAKMDAERMERLFAGSAVTKDALEKAQVAAKSAAAALEAAQATVTKAETGLAVAEKNLSDSCVRAPYDAIVTRKHRNVGDYVGPGVCVFSVENPSVYEVSFSLNAAHFARVKPGKTTVRLAQPLAGKPDGERRHADVRGARAAAADGGRRRRHAAGRRDRLRVAHGAGRAGVGRRGPRRFGGSLYGCGRQGSTNCGRDRT